MLETITTDRSNRGPKWSYTVASIAAVYFCIQRAKRSEIFRAISARREPLLIGLGFVLYVPWAGVRAAVRLRFSRQTTIQDGVVHS